MATDRVLFVDDDAALLRGLQRIATATLWVATAESGAAALRLLAESELDVVVSDLRMPVMNGHELAREVRRRDPSLSVVFLAGSIRVADLAEPKPFRYLQKPVPLAALRKVLVEAALACRLARALHAGPQLTSNPRFAAR